MPRDPLVNFWIHVMAMMEYHPSFSVPNGPRLTDEIIERIFVLSPLAADGFVEGEFEFLPPDELARLKTAVAGVRAVASELGGRLVATPEERNRALPHFKTIVDVLAPDRFADPDAFRLGKLIERELTPYPQSLDHLRFMSGTDSTGDPALWVWAFVKETGEHDERGFLKVVEEIKPLLKAEARAVAPDGRVYLRFRSTLDQPEEGGIAA